MGVRAGFSVMEALVSVALIGVAMIPLYLFQQTLADASFGVASELERLEAHDSAVAYLSAFDPIAEPQGEIEIADWTLTWNARRVAGENPADGYLGGSNYAVYLYEVDAELSRGSQVRRFTIRRVAWELVRSPASVGQ